MKIGVVVMAAGQGKRMKSALPKVLHPLAGRPIVSWVLAALDEVDTAHVVVVVGHGAEMVREMLPAGYAVTVQEEQLGTGHATLVGLDALDPACETVIVVSGDTPLIAPDLMRDLATEHAGSGRAGTIVSAILDDPGDYGRVLRGEDGSVRVVEARDASPDELAVPEINAGLYAFDRRALERALVGIGRANAQGEMYLPDALPLLDGPAGVLVSRDPHVVLGVNSRADLAACETVVQERLRAALLTAGVAMPDPSGVYLDAGVEVGSDSVVWPGTHLRGATKIGSGCQIGPHALITDCTVGDETRIVFAHLTGSEIGAGCELGPFAYLRPGNRISDGAKIGAYVEVKNSTLGPGAKVPHLSYIGDTEIGERTNIGAGNITANYDGFRKHRTFIGSYVKTGSDCVFVAPVRIGDRAMTAAGSIITHDVPAGALGIARARQDNKEGFTERAEAKARSALDREREAGE